MFSGIIQGRGRVVAVEPTPGGGLALTVDPAAFLAGGERMDRGAGFPAYGASICVSGCCLTVSRSEPESGRLSFDVIPETLRMTRIGSLEVGSEVNLEPSVLPTTRLDGHVVQGHVEGLGEVLGIGTHGEWRARIAAPRALMPAIVPKGSIAIDGVSLTVAAVDAGANWFEITLIPTTLELTTLGQLNVGDLVHLETDMLARTAIHWLTHFGPAIAGR